MSDGSDAEEPIGDDMLAGQNDDEDENIDDDDGDDDGGATGSESHSYDSSLPTSHSVRFLTSKLCCYELHIRNVVAL